MGFVDAVDPGGLKRDEGVDHRFQLWKLGVVAVVAGDVGEQHPSRLAGDEPRHRSVIAQRSQHRGLVREELGHVLEPHEALIGRDLPDRRQVPCADLHRLAGDGHVFSGPLEVRRRSTRSGVRRAQWVVVELACPWRQHGTRVAADELGEVGGRRLEGSLAVEQPQDDDLEAELLSHCRDDGLRLLPPRRRDGERGQRSPRRVEDDGDDARDGHRQTRVARQSRTGVGIPFMTTGPISSKATSGTWPSTSTLA